jgi:hypothetical protein
MKKLLTLIAVAIVAGAMYVAAAPGSQQSTGPTAKQFKALKKQVATLTKTVASVKKLATAEGAVLTACMKVAVPINQFGDPDGSLSGTAQGYDYGKTTFPGTPGPTTGFFTTGLDVTATTDTNAVWFTGGDATCRPALGQSALRHAMSHKPTFVAHGH